MRRFVSLLILAAAACSEPAPAPVPAAAPAPTPVVALDPAKGAILPAEKAQQLSHQCSRISPGPVTGSWAPEGATIQDLEARLGAELEKQLAPVSDAGATPQDYYRQYAGLIIGGRNIIYINGIHANAIERDQRGTDTWKTEPAMICDGGTITFGVEYDPATHAFANFAFNGRL